MDTYDVVIIGGGPAGLSAAIYAARSGRTVAVVEALAPGGLMNGTPEIENYPGVEKIAGYELAQKMAAQAEGFGAQIVYAKAERIEDGEVKKVTLSSGTTLTATALVLAVGSMPRPLGVPNEEQYLGQGLSYCATCDGNFFRAKTVAVAGAGAFVRAAAEYLLPIAARVYALYEGKADDIEGAVCVGNARVTELRGMPLREIAYTAADGEHTLAADGLFVAKGYAPAMSAFRDLVQTDAAGYIRCDEAMETSARGIFAAGDARVKTLRQVATAVADGAVAGQAAALYCKRLRKK